MEGGIAKVFYRPLIHAGVGMDFQVDFQGRRLQNKPCFLIYLVCK